MPTPKLLAVVLSALVLLVVGCSDDPEADREPRSPEASSTSAEPDPDVLSGEVIEQLVQALTGDDAARLTQALELTEPGSVAYEYTDYQRAFTNARIDAGLAGQGTGFDAPEAVDFGGWQVCPPGGVGDECVTFAAFEGTGGLVSSFTVNDVDLASHISAGDGRARRVGRDLGAIKLLYAYESVSSGNLVIVAEVTSESESLELGSAFSAIYRNPSGERLDAGSAVVPKRLGPQSTGTLAIYFPEPAVIGGTVGIDVYDADADPHSVSLSTK